MWIKVRNELRHSPKLIAISIRTGVSPLKALGAVVNAWMIADAHGESNGFIPFATFESLDTQIGLIGLCNAMEEVGWLKLVRKIDAEKAIAKSKALKQARELDDNEADMIARQWSTGGVIFPEYLEHNGSTEKERCQNAKRNQKSRNKKKKAKSQGNKKNGKSDTPNSNASVTREEKRRIEIIYKEYPRKRAKAQALKAITKALQKESYELLLEKTKAFAQQRKGKDPEFTPYPATWFNREHYHDEPEENKKPETKLPTLKAGTHDWN